jgi:hypothetical protein
MRDKKDFKILSLEEQEKEARQDATGRIKKYLHLAEKLFSGDENLTADAA